MNRAREAIKDNHRPSSAGGRFWELSGGVIVCGDCGCRMLPHRKRRSHDSERFHHYYRCSTRQQNGKDACSQWRSYRAEELEAEVWDFVSHLVTTPTMLREQFDHEIQLLKEGSRGDPEQEAQTWLRRLEDLDRQRERAQNLTIEGLLDTDELKAKLAQLKEQREVAERELAACRNRQGHIEELELTQLELGQLFLQYVCEGPRIMASWPPEDRHALYRRLRLRVKALPEGEIDIEGVLKEKVCKNEPTFSGGSTAGR